MENPIRVPEPESLKRERDVFKLFAAFRGIPQVENLGPSPDTDAIPSNYSPKPASDASLAAFCQLAAIRLQAARSLISLIDGKNQYILAEATPRTSLKFDSPLNRTVDLGFGNVCLPRNWGICEKVLDPIALAEGREGVIIINDLTQSKDHEGRSYVKDGPLRFYAGVPLTSPMGSIVGAVCILDDRVRDGLSEDDILYLQDLASTIMDYLNTYIVKDRYRRGAEGLHGLMSFAEGASKIKPFNEFYRSPSSPGVAQPKSMADELEVQYSEDENGVTAAAHSPREGCGTSESSRQRPSARRNSISDLQDSLVPAAIKELFARAADIMRCSNDMDGVYFMDASIAGTGFHGAQPSSASKRCQILGFATPQGSSTRGDVLPVGMTPFESNFQWVLEQYPNGYSLDCEAAQEHTEFVSSGPLSGTKGVMRPGTGLAKVLENRTPHIARLQALIPDIKSALFLPFWDFDRSRWFAGCFCWSTRSERTLDGQLDLPFLKAFGHSIMQEVARLDAMTTDRAKTTFLSSLSHELRTPLHGILGSTNETAKCNLGFVTEEMVETMMIGQSPFDLAISSSASDSPSVDQECRRIVSRRRTRFLIIDIGDYDNLGYYLSASSYGRIVMNLFGNALKFTESGHVQVRLRTEHTFGPKGTVVLNISDSGIGMSQHFLKNSAFEPFRKQNQHTSGTGVGLSVVKRILEDVGGQIEVHSEPSKGTNITLKLPLERMPDQEASDAKLNPLPAAMSGLKDRKVCVYVGGPETNEMTEQAEPRKLMQHPPANSTPVTTEAPEHASGSLDKGEARVSLYPPTSLVNRVKPEPTAEDMAVPTVTAQSQPEPATVDAKTEAILALNHALIVDDNAINLRLLSAWMKRRELPFTEAQDGLQALNTYKSAPRKHDMILMDISMPVMDGMTSTRLIREYEQEHGLVPSHIIALTGLTSVSAKLEAWSSGVDDFLTKPVDFKKLEFLMEAGRGGEGTGFLQWDGV
ncbi:hypothetical protein EK21DRAFT_99834 [Setomelanomma holmii]|uniref:histidine kinase n=1 Tax=Setomelanomma holmii TaxID=210430 RepID=A0A9P4LNI3_9PLEO|nr:hypothetical protein EK21DRAFT_99834 [Setomelanomma holmii]